MLIYLAFVSWRAMRLIARFAQSWAFAVSHPAAGLTNAVSGLCGAGLAGSAVVCIAGQHPTTEDGLGSFQEAYGSEVCRSFSNLTRRVIDWSTIEVDLRQAFRGATSPPQGVALVEIPTNILYRGEIESNQRRGAKVYAPGELRSGADPHSIEQAIEILLAAKRPLIEQSTESSGRVRQPNYANSLSSRRYRCTHGEPGKAPWWRTTRLQSEVHGRSRSLGAPTRYLAIGFRFWSGEKFGEAPTWSESARYIQADATPTRIGLHVLAEVAMVGDAKLILRQLSNAARSHD